MQTIGRMLFAGSVIACACVGEPGGGGDDSSESEGSSAPATSRSTGETDSSTSGATATTVAESTGTTTAETTGDPATSAAESSPPPPADHIVVDHHWVDRFDEIPAEYVDAAAQLRMFFMDRSVGGNIDEALTCLASSFDDAPNHCKRADHSGDPSLSVDPAQVHWDGSYDRSNWSFAFWPDGCDEWHGSVQCFADYVDPMLAELDVVSFQYSYLAVAPGSDIADPAAGYFADNPDRGDVHDVMAFSAAHPDHVIIHWTTSLARGIGSSESESFNEAMRAWADEQDAILFDVADILSHAPDGTPCFDNRDGVPYPPDGSGENHADDGVALAAICQHYTSETDGGHLGAPSVGKIRVAKGYWVLMARIAGWEPDA